MILCLSTKRLSLEPSTMNEAIELYGSEILVPTSTDEEPKPYKKEHNTKFYCEKDRDSKRKSRRNKRKAKEHNKKLYCYLVGSTYKRWEGAHSMAVYDKLCKKTAMDSVCKTEFQKDLKYYIGDFKDREECKECKECKSLNDEKADDNIKYLTLEDMHIMGYLMHRDNADPTEKEIGKEIMAHVSALRDIFQKLT